MTPNCGAQVDGQVSAKKLEWLAEEQCGVPVWLNGCISQWPNCFDCIEAQAYLNLFNNTGIQIQIYMLVVPVFVALTYKRFKVNLVRTY